MNEVGATVLSDTVCHLGEGPTYDPAAGKLFWFDILESRLLEADLSSGRTMVHQLPEMASALAVINDGHQLLVTETGLHIRDVATGGLTQHMPIEADNPATRSNDSRVHPCGAFWVGTMGKKAERGAGAIYWFFKGELRTLYPGISIPNSICFSPDGAVAYYADTRENILYRVACDPATGVPTGDPAVFYDQRGQNGGLDGSVVDADGILWNARWGAGCVDAYSPAGERIRTVRVPASQASCPAFVGAGAGRLAVTSAREGMNAEKRAADPEAGKTFLLDIAVNGRFEPRVLI